MGLIGTLIIGAIAGWLAGQIMSGRGFGIVGNIALGILGAFVAGMVFPAVGLGGEGTGEDCGGQGGAKDGGCLGHGSLSRGLCSSMT